MKRSWSSLCLLLLIGVLLLSACSNNSGGGNSPNATDDPSSPKPSESAPPEESGLKTDGLIPASDLSKNPSAATARKDTFIVGIDAPKGVFHPLYQESVYDAYVNAALFDSLLSTNKDGSPGPGLAEKWDISEDKLVYTFHLVKDAKFSDGTPITAEDVAFTTTLLFDKAYTGPVDATTTSLKGGKDYKEGKATSISGIRVVDPHTIEFTTEKISATTLTTLGGPVISKAYYGKGYKQGNLDYLKDLYLKPMGSGPYILDKYIAGQEVRLKANPSYWNGAPKIPNLIYKTTTDDTRIQLLQTGEIDIDQVAVNKDSVEQLQSFGFLDVNLFPTNGYGYIAFNHKRPLFQDKKVRQALTYGLDRKQIVDAVYQGYADVLNVPQSKVSWSYTDDVNKYEFNLETAKKLLDEAGWVVGSDGIREKDGVKFKISFAASTPNPVNEAIIPIAEENYKELGIEFVAEQMEFNAMLDKREKGDFDMLFMAWSLTPEPDTTEIFGTGGPYNDIGYSNAEADKLLAQGISELEIDKRKPVYQELYKVLNDDLPYIFLYQRRDMWAVNARVQGFDMSPFREFTSDLHKIEIK
ncbi:ABC transporter substrate-binding protein [Paenibacillus sp. GCM10023252]|uniref:ABC transporter substrate-binding protein n=1 Tax=Paenibacillus sp. GCM10023252 TaxID=3252649 RepID=UPI00361D7E78